MRKEKELNDIIERQIADTLEDIPKAHESKRCVSKPIGCGQRMIWFRDQLSLKEYRISGLCQECQDKIFGTED